MAGRKSKYYSENLNENKIWQVAIYIRLSQEDSDNGEGKQESNSVTSQKTLINEFVEENDDLAVFDTYVDDGFSGTDFDRPGFQRMMEDMKDKNINCIIIKDLSRLGRNHYEAGNYIEKVFPLFNIRFISINDRIDSYKDPSSVNTMLVPFKNLMNDEYARDTSTKIKSALNSRKKKGEFIGAFPSYGYVKDENDKHKLIIDEESAEIVRKIFEWKVNEGLGNLAICHRLNDMGVLNPTGHKRKKLNQNYNNSEMKEDDYSWCPSTVRNILKNDVYIGNVTQGKRKVKSYKIHKVEQVPEDEWVTVENMHEPIIEKELFNKAQGLRQVDTRVQDTGYLSMWAGILKCADCGRAMHKKICKNKSGTVYEYYICGTYRKKSNKLCTKHTLKIEELENSVLEAIKLHIELLIDTENILDQINKSKIKQLPNANMDSIKQAKEKEIERLNNLKRCLYEDWKNEDITREEYLEYKQKYEQDIEKLKDIILNLDKQKEKQEEIIEGNSQWIENFKKYKNIFELDRNITTELIDNIEVYENKKIKIHFKFMNELDKILEYINKENKTSILEKIGQVI
ncbi:MAG: recombinase family protein [Clostridia bacterium]|nr:recombinase family protein [Clostridia bacterium]